MAPRRNIQPPFAVIFDMDGVLIDSVPATLYGRRKLAHHFGFTSEEMAAHSKPGRSLRDFYVELQNFRPFAATFTEFADSMLEAVFEYLEKHIHGPDPALLDFLCLLEEHHIPMAIGTSAVRRSAKRKLALVQLDARFETIVCAEDVNKHKPNPDIYLKASRRLGMAPSKCIVIEDAPDGILAGHAAGMKVIGLSKYLADAVTLSNADIVVADFSDLSYQKLLQLVKT